MTLGGVISVDYSTIGGSGSSRFSPQKRIFPALCSVGRFWTISRIPAILSLCDPMVMQISNRSRRGNMSSRESS